MNRRIAYSILGIIIVLSFFLRLPTITVRSIWFDEAFTWRIINFPVSEMIIRAATDVHPPFYYTLLHIWIMVFDGTIVSLRLFSILLSVASVILIYIFQTTALRSRLIGLGSAAVMAVSGWQIALAQEARMYTLGIFLSLVTSLILIYAVRRRNWWRLWVLYGLTCALFAYTHYFSFFTLAAQGLWLIGYILFDSHWRLQQIARNSVTRGTAFAVVVALLLYSPWIPVFLGQNQQVQGSFWVPPTTRWSIPDTFYRMYFPVRDGLAHEGMAMVVTLLPLIITVLVWGWLLRRGKFSFDQSGARYLLILCGIIPFCFSIALSLFGQSIYQDRFLAFASPFLFCALIVAVWSIFSKPVFRIASISVIIVFVLIAGLRYQNQLDIPSKGGLRQAMEFAMLHQQSEELILVNSPFIFFGVDHYLTEYYENSIPSFLYSESSELIHFAGAPILKTTDTMTSQALLKSSASRMWVIDTTGFGSSPLTFDSSWKKGEQRSYPEVFPYQGDIMVTQYSR